MILYRKSTYSLFLATEVTYFFIILYACYGCSYRHILYANTHLLSFVYLRVCLWVCLSVLQMISCRTLYFVGLPKKNVYRPTQTHERYLESDMLSFPYHRHTPVSGIILHITYRLIPCKHKTLNQCWVNVESTSYTAGQHSHKIFLMRLFQPLVKQDVIML